MHMVAKRRQGSGSIAPRAGAEDQARREDHPSDRCGWEWMPHMAALGTRPPEFKSQLPQW